MNRNTTLETISTITLFLILEVLAFISFGLSNSFIVFASLGIVIAILMGIISVREIKKDGFISVLFFAIPLFIFGLISALSPFASGGGLSLAESIFLPVGLLAFAAMGYFSGVNSKFDMSKALIAIYGGIALIVLISYFFTMIQFVPFYTIIHAKHYVYYDGGISSTPIGETAYFLMGFKFQEVSIQYFTLFPSVLSSSVIALFFISPKKEKLKFSIYAIYAAIGLIALLTMPIKITIITDVLLLVIITLIILFGKKVIKGSQILKWIIIGFLIVILIAFIILVLNAQTLWGWTEGFRNFIASHQILNRLFNSNRFVVNYNLILKYAFGSNTIIGWYPIGTEVDISNSILFDTIITSGVLGLVVLVIDFVFTRSTISDYYVKGNDDILTKSLILGFVSSFFVYSLINYDAQPLLRYNNLSPIYTNGLFLIAIFFIGYMFKVTNSKNNEVKKTVSIEAEAPIYGKESEYEI